MYFGASYIDQEGLLENSSNTCTYNSVIYNIGDNFPAGDQCNQFICSVTSVLCTEIVCINNNNTLLINTRLETYSNDLISSINSKDFENFYTFLTDKTTFTIKYTECCEITNKEELINAIESKFPWNIFEFNLQDYQLDIVYSQHPFLEEGYLIGVDVSNNGIALKISEGKVLDIYLFEII